MELTGIGSVAAITVICYLAGVVVLSLIHI